MAKDHIVAHQETVKRDFVELTESNNFVYGLFISSRVVSWES